ncbi:hypothetical protein IAU59_004486 [Kwoniella sp. CBS 9459]
MLVQPIAGHRRYPSASGTAAKGTQPGRYDPYPSTLRRSTHQPGHLLTTRPLAPHPRPTIANSGTMEADSERRTKVDETTRSTGRYQPSRGAQRDAKYSKKLAATASQATGESARRAATDSARKERVMPEGTSQAKAQTQAQYRQTRVVDPKARATFTQHELQIGANSYSYPRHSLDHEVFMEQIRKEQIAAVEAARKEHRQALALVAKKEEEDRKVRRIQLQVFVHARPTHCEWDNCEAVLNSWALLEKHLHHAHLHPRLQASPNAGPVRCHWQKCSEAFRSREECYRHTLTGHMGNFAARCPFNCLFQGPSFPSLMAHITRRHPDATPDDFVPGLIPFPPVVPPLSSLPKLPEPATYEVVHWLKPVTPYKGGIGHRNRKMVVRNCKKGRYPRVDAYEDKRGASAAIRAIIENAKRLRDVPPQFAIIVKREGEEIRGITPGKSEDEEQPATARTVVELVDVQKTARSATDAAKMEYFDQIGMDDHLSSSTCSVCESNDSRDQDRAPSAAASKKRCRVSNATSQQSVTTTTTATASVSGTSSSSQLGRGRNHLGSSVEAANASSPRKERLMRRRLRLTIGRRKSQSTEIEMP